MFGLFAVMRYCKAGNSNDADAALAVGLHALFSASWSCDGLWRKALSRGGAERIAKDTVYAAAITRDKAKSRARSFKDAATRSDVARTQELPRSPNLGEMRWPGPMAIRPISATGD